jgi:hypothetical protein
MKTESNQPIKCLELLNTKLESQSPHSMVKSICIIFIMVGYCSFIVYLLAKCAENHKTTGISPEHLGWFVYISFFIVAFCTASVLGYMFISSIFDDMLDFINFIKKINREKKNDSSVV